MAEGDRNGDRLVEVARLELAPRMIEVGLDRGVAEADDRRGLLACHAAGRERQTFSRAAKEGVRRNFQEPASGG